MKPIRLGVLLSGVEHHDFYSFEVVVGHNPDPDEFFPKSYVFCLYGFYRDDFYRVDRCCLKAFSDVCPAIDARDALVFFQTLLDDGVDGCTALDKTCAKYPGLGFRELLESLHYDPLGGES
ncbi:MAG: hypothetical protein K2O32_15210 [Acetatifactor sp.]|nr:hypothetical protein [Acetatifactor sp.]